MYHLLRRIILVRPPSSVFPRGFSGSPLKFHRYLSTSSEIVSSQESAALASDFVKLANKKKRVIAFFENHGFAESQISELVKRFPRVLSSNLEKTLLPKLLFFQSKGLSSSEIAKLVCAWPRILYQSLNGRIIPNFDYIKSLVQTEAKTITAIKRHVPILSLNPRIYSGHNVEILKQMGMSGSKIATLLQYQPRIFLMNSTRFKEIAKEVKDMGFDPQQANFGCALMTLQSMSKSTWDKKVEVYKKWGWSEEGILLAFRRQPWCMMASEEKISGTMDFLVNKIGCESSYIATRPYLILFSLKRRIVPRGSVYQVLLSEGLIKKNVDLYMFFKSTEKRFLEKFMKPYQKQIPGLLKLYEEKLEDSNR